MKKPSPEGLAFLCAWRVVGENPPQIPQNHAFHLAFSGIGEYNSFKWGCLVTPA
jgi:hypothetical protein